MGRPSGLRFAWLLPLVILALVAVVWRTVLRQTNPGVHVTVINHGPQALHTVALQVTGRAHVLGDIPPGQSRTRKVLPTGQSHIEVEFTDEQGKRVRLDAGGDLDDSSRGTVEIGLRDGRIESATAQITSGSP